MRGAANSANMELARDKISETMCTIALDGGSGRQKMAFEIAPFSPVKKKPTVGRSMDASLYNHSGGQLELSPAIGNPVNHELPKATLRDLAQSSDLSVGPREHACADMIILKSATTRVFEEGS